MTSYVNEKTRVFRDPCDTVEPGRKRSEGRMKTYPSATDARAWTIVNEDRRQHILELIQYGGGKVLPLQPPPPMSFRIWGGYLRQGSSDF